MLRTGTGISKTQTMSARGHTDCTDSHTRVDALGIECQEADRIWQNQECIWLRIAWLLRPRSTAQQSECPAKEQHTPMPSLLHIRSPLDPSLPMSQAPPRGRHSAAGVRLRPGKSLSGVILID